MATVRPGHRAVLLIVDLQRGVIADAWDAARVVRNAAHAVERARAAAVPVIWVQHENHELPRDSEAWQWAPGLQPGAGELRVYKRYNSAFEATALDDTLAGLGATRVVLAGAASNWCIRATAYAALDRGYDLTLVSDAHTTSPMTLDDGTTIDAATVVADLNVTMTWLQYPGRVTRTVPAAQLDFAAPGASGSPG